VQIKPKELVLPKGGLSAGTKRLLKMYASTAEHNSLSVDDREGFWSAEMTADELLRHQGLWKGPNGESNEQHWPACVRESEQHELVLSSLGGMVSYLMKLMIVSAEDENSLLTQSTFVEYNPMRHGTRLMLDGQTLQNLDILENSADGTEHGTLLSLLCLTTSGFGKRLFRKWLCHPLKHTSDIEQRFEALEDLSQDEHGDFKAELQRLLRDLPDLERLCSQIHMGSCKLATLVGVLDAFEKIQDFVEELDIVDGFQSARLRQLLTFGAAAFNFPNMEAELSEMTSAFDVPQARDENNLSPSPGSLPDYDAAQQEMDEIDKLMATSLKECKRKFGAGKWYHPKSGNDKYQIELPPKTKIPSGWEKKTQTKAVVRVWTPEIAQLQPRLAEATDRLNTAKKSALSEMLKMFDQFSDKWTRAVACLAELDCLLSLSLAKDNMGAPMCRPQFVKVEEGDDAVFEVTDLRHPCLVESGACTSYVPNSTALGGDGPSAMILTGPNMGGKSTLLRQNCIAVIMAQLGAWVPAESFKLSPVDRIFTRIGANDNIIAGRSTFMVELKETANILHSATPHSLVILDELGRGTSTFDGYSIAHATLNHVLDTTNCRLMFATHYHLLTDSFALDERVKMQHMSYFVQKDSRDVTCLYKLKDGVCSKSYGLSCSTQAGLPKEIVDRAEKKSEELEALSNSKTAHTREHDKKIRTFRHLCKLIDQGATSKTTAGRLDALLKMLA